MGQQQDQGRNLKILETSENENTMIQLLWGMKTAILKGKFIALQFYLKKKKKYTQINNLILHLNLKKNRKQTPK